MTDTLVRPTRRTLVRSAAWSVPVVSLAAMAPAFAASGKAKMSAGSADKWGKDAQGLFHVSWDLFLANDSQAITSFRLEVSYTPNGTGSFDTFFIDDFTTTPGTAVTPGGWGAPVITGVTKPFKVSSTRTAGYAAYDQSGIHVDFAGAENSRGDVTATAYVVYANGVTDTLTVGPIAWGPGSAHTTHNYV